MSDSLEDRFESHVENLDIHVTLSDKTRWNTGVPGPKGDPFTWNDLTTQQKEDLRGVPGAQGPTGPRGPKGDTFTWNDLTAEQKAELRGPRGYTGAAGARGQRGPQGEQGPAGADASHAYLNLVNSESDSDSDSSDSSGYSYSRKAVDQAVNYWTADTVVDSIGFPDPVQGRSREFFLSVTMPASWQSGTSYTLSVPPSISIKSYVSGPLSVSLSAGNIVVFGFTEISPSVFMVTRKILSS